jgi:hypothetical protein
MLICQWQPAHLRKPVHLPTFGQTSAFWTMAYNQFKKLDDLRKKLGLTDVVAPWLPEPPPALAPTERLLADLLEARQEALTTEKAKSEFIVVPILKELRRLSLNRFSIFSGCEFNVDRQMGLAGFCDFIISAEVQRLEITAPVLCLVEAKNAEIERGLGQCGAEMFAAQRFNQQEGRPNWPVFGCVTNAFSWCFLKLAADQLYIDPSYVPLTFTEPHRVLGVLLWVLDQSLPARG